MSASSTSRIKAIFCDMDGTLLNPSHRISDFTAETLKELKRKDIKFIVCTGRPYPDVFATIRKCGLEPDYIITSNGARIHDKDFNLLKSHSIDPKIAEELCSLWPTPGLDGEILRVGNVDKQAATAVDGRRKMFVSGFYQGGNWVTDEVIPEARAAFNEALPSVNLGDAFHYLKAKDLADMHHFWFQITRNGTPDDLRNISNYMNENYTATNQLTLTSSAPYVLEVLPFQITKGKAVTEVAELLRVPLCDVACFGDAWNDMPMLEISGHPFVMANAHSGIREALPRAEVVGSNAEDGVARKLVELFLS